MKNFISRRLIPALTMCAATLSGALAGEPQRLQDLVPGHIYGESFRTNYRKTLTETSTYHDQGSATRMKANAENGNSPYAKEIFVDLTQGKKVVLQFSTQKDAELFQKALADKKISIILQQRALPDASERNEFHGQTFPISLLKIVEAGSSEKIEGDAYLAKLQRPKTTPSLIQQAADGMKNLMQGFGLSSVESDRRVKPDLIDPRVPNDISAPAISRTAGTAS